MGKQRMSDDFEKIKKEASTTIEANASSNDFRTYERRSQEHTSELQSQR